jgi:hypothetical protein
MGYRNSAHATWRSIIQSQIRNATPIVSPSVKRQRMNRSPIWSHRPSHRPMRRPGNVQITRPSHSATTGATRLPTLSCFPLSSHTMLANVMDLFKTQRETATAGIWGLYGMRGGSPSSSATTEPAQSTSMARCGTRGNRELRLVILAWR